MTRAVILAAGMSSRLGAATGGKPKCLLDLHGIPLIEHMLRLLKACEINDNWIVTGYEAGSLVSTVGEGVSFRYYSNYSRTNNLHTLASCADLLDPDTLVIFSDVLVQKDSLLNCIGSSGYVTLIVDRTQVRSGTMRVTIKDETISDIGSHIDPKDGHGNFIGIAKISAGYAYDFRSILARCASDPNLQNAYYTEIFRCMAHEGHQVQFVDANANEWFEIDTVDDYETAKACEFYLKV